MHCSSRNGNRFEGKTEIQGNLRGTPPSLPPFPQKIKINAIWGYPEVSFMEIKLNFFVLTTTDWNHISDNQVKAPILQMTDLYLKHQLKCILLSNLNQRLGPAMYTIKIKNCSITKPGAVAFQAPLSPHTFTPSSTGLLAQWPSSNWKVCRCLELYSSFCFLFFKPHIQKELQESHQTNPATIYWYPLPFIGTAAVVNSFATVFNSSDRYDESFTFRTVRTFAFSHPKHGAEACRNDCVQACLPASKSNSSGCVHN